MLTSSPRPRARPNGRSAGGGLDFDRWIARGWDTLDDILERRGERRLAEINDRDSRRTRANERDRDRRLDARERLKDRRQDARRREELADARTAENNRSKETLTGLKLEDGRARYGLQSRRQDAQRDDARALIETRADVYRAAFESRRGDTLISRLMWPAALAVAVGGGIYLIGTWSKR